MSDILFQLLIIGLCYKFHTVVSTKKSIQLVYFQLIITALFLTKPVFYLFVIPNIFLGFWFSKYIRLAYLYSIIPITVCLLYMNWNYQRTGNFEFSSIKNINLQNYNLYYFNVNKYGEDYAVKVNTEISKKASLKTSYAEQQKEIKNLTLNYIKKDFIQYVPVHLKGSIRMFIDPGRFDVYNYFEFENTDDIGFLQHLNKNGLKGAFKYFKNQPLLILILIPIILIFNLIKVIGFLFYWIANLKKTPPLYWFMLLIITYISFLTGPVGSARYLLPILPIYLLFSTIGWQHIIKKASNRH